VGNEDIEAPVPIIPVAKVCFIIAKAHGFDVKVDVTEPGTGSNPTDKKEIAVLHDHEDDLEQLDLVALTWLGRDEGHAAEWDEVRQLAACANIRHTAGYLGGNPLLGDHIEAGPDAVGLSCSG